jgi:hypothetical protein
VFTLAPWTFLRPAHARAQVDFLSLVVHLVSLTETSRASSKLYQFFWTEVQFYLTWPVHPQAWEPLLAKTPFFCG